MPHERLSDKILEALKLSVEQEDIQVADALVNALELSITRCTGGRTFVERRDYPQAVEDILQRLSALKKKP